MIRCDCVQEEFGNGVQFNNHRAGTDRLPNTCNVSFMMDDRLTGKTGHVSRTHKRHTGSNARATSATKLGYTGN